MKLLIVEDEKSLAKDIVNYLSMEDYHCETAFTFAEADDKLSQFNYDCVMVDLMLPDGEGIKLVKKIKDENRKEGIIIISAKSGIEEKVQALKYGADDYLAKPFHLFELSARVFSVIRRSNFNQSNILELGDLNIDLLSKTVKINGQIINLTKKEYELLLFFISNKNRVISKGAIAETLSGDMADMFDNYDFIYAHVKNLKKKLAEGGIPICIKTVYGNGYKWEL